MVLGLIFLRHISQAFEAKREALLTEDASAAEDHDEYLAENIFWVPKDARWSQLQANARQPSIGKLVDDAMLAIEAANPSLKGVLPKDYNRPALDKIMVGELIDLISGISLREERGNRRAISSAVSTSIFLAGSQDRKASGEANSIPPARSYGCSWKCLNRSRTASATSKAGFMTHVAAPAVCLYRLSVFWRRMAVALASSPSMDRKATTRPGASAR